MIAIILVLVGLISIVMMFVHGNKNRTAEIQNTESDLVYLHGQNLVKVRDIIVKLEDHIQKNGSGSTPFMDGLTFSEAKAMMETQEKELLSLRPTIVEHGKDLPPKVRRRNIQLLKDNLNQADYVSLHIR